IIVGKEGKTETIYANSFILKNIFKVPCQKAEVENIDFNASHDMRTLLDTFSLTDEMGIMVLRHGLKSYFIENIITIMKSNPLLVLEFIKKFILYDDLKEVFLKALCLNPAQLFNFSNKEIHENILYKLISRSELCLEENLLLSKMIQWLLDTNWFLDKPVKLTNENLVFECPVPKSLLTKVKYTKSEEFTDIRYTAITCDPDEFEIKKYLIRQKKYKQDTEIMIVITMYNENDTLFIKTMSSVIKNIAYICSKESWGDEGWQKIVMLIVSDGRNKINKRTLNVLSAMGCYQDGIMQDCIKKRAVTVHLFEYTTQLMVDNYFNVKGKDYTFNSDPHVGGACGEIKVDFGYKCRNLLNPLIAFQNFKYKMSNILDKPSESVFGYISVLPGVFSIYRYKAIINGPLESYFKGETMYRLDATKTGIFEANMYLAEDRILSFELVIKKNESWKLKYIKSAKAETDVPDNVPEFISQRRRWLNGSFFTAFYSISKFNRIWRSGQPFFRKILLQIQFVYNGIQLIFNWFSLSTTSNPAIDPFKGHGDNLFDAAQSLYLIIIVIIFICSMGNRPQGTKLIYTLSIPPIDFKNLSNIQETLRNAAFYNINIGNLSGVLLTEEDPESVKINIIEEGEDKNAAYENII
ncbi:17172_t:CDS:2, partial [Dentiscutata erythropus]